MNNEKYRNFKGIWLPREIWLREDLSLLDKAIIAEVESLDRGEGCNASDAYLAEFFRVSKSHLSNTLSSLRERGLIETKAFDGRRRLLKQTAYRVCITENSKAALLKTVEQPYEIQEPSLIRDNKGDSIDDISCIASPQEEPSAQPVGQEPASTLSDPTPKPKMSNSRRIAIALALMKMDGTNPLECTAPGKYNGYAKKLWTVNHDVTEAEICHRFARLRSKYAGWDPGNYTSGSLVAHWGELGMSLTNTSIYDGRRV